MRSLLLRLAAPALSCLSLLASCVEFNECEEATGERLASAAIDLDLRESVVRTQEAPVGNLVTDALLTVAEALCAQGTLPCPDVALQNAGGIRQETACGSRDYIEAGAIYQRDMEDLMPFENDLVVVSLSGADLKLALERSVSSLGQAGEASAAGHFLQASGLRMSVDCAGAPQVVAVDQRSIQAPGERVALESIRITSRGRDEALELDREYQVVTNSFIAKGRDGFLSFFFRDENNVVLEDSDGPVLRFDAEADTAKDSAGNPVKDRRAVADWLRAQDQSGAPVGRPTEGRILIQSSCYGGAR